MSAPLSDDDFVQRIRSGDASAFEALFREHYAPLVSFAAGLLRVADGADDVVSDVFAGLWEQRARWAPLSVRAYLYGAVRHRVYNRLRDAKATIGWDETDDDGSAAAVRGLHDTAPLADAALLHAEANVAIRAAIDALPPARRMAMMLRWQRGMSFDEIAHVMGISANAVQLHISRALKTLRTIVPGQLG